MSPDQGADPNGEHPNGDDTTGNERSGNFPEIQKELLRAIAAVDNKESATEDAMQKFGFLLGQRFDVDPLKQYSIYVRGVYSKDVKKALCDLQEAKLINKRPSQSRKVNTDTFALTDKGEEVLKEIGDDPRYGPAYKFFQNRYGASGSWKKYDEMVLSLVTEESRYVAVDYPLFESQRKKAAVSDDVDSLFEFCLSDKDPGFVNRFDEEKAPIAKLGAKLVREKKVPGDKPNEKVENRVRFSTRYIRRQWGSHPVDSDGKYVLLCGYTEKIQDMGKIFYLKEDRIEGSPSIRIEFFGDWEKPARDILEKHSIIVLGYVTESNDEITIYALAILQAGELPTTLQGSDSEQQATLFEFENRNELNSSFTHPEGQTSLSDFRNQRNSIIENIQENEREFLDGHDGEVSREKEENFVGALGNLLKELFGTDDDLIEWKKLKRSLEEASDKLEPVDTGIRIGFVIEVLKWIWKNIDLPF